MVTSNPSNGAAFQTTPDSTLTPTGKIIRRNVDGLLLLDKPVGLSSTQAMAAAKRLYRAEKAGHTGTLDPFATGLLPICFGEATKFSRFMLDAEKGYRATLKLGEVSSTGDTEGEITRRREVNITPAQIDAVLAKFVGEQAQIPPMYSALKQDGVALYKLARQGIEVHREARQIRVFSLFPVSFSGNELVIDTQVSKGTYIRVLAEEIGEALGCGAHLTGLRRTSTGGFAIGEAITLEALAALDEPARDRLLLPAETLSAALPQVVLSAEDARIFCNGGWLPAPASYTPSEKLTTPIANEYAIFDEGKCFLGVAEIALQHEKPRLIPMRLMATGSRS